MPPAYDHQSLQTTLAEVSYAYSIVDHQDSLLQSYRGFQTVLQSTLLGVSSVLLVLGLQVEEAPGRSLAFIMLVILATLATMVRLILNRVIAARGEDVTLAQKSVIRLEQQLPRDKRQFCTFKYDQVRLRHPPGKCPQESDYNKLFQESITSKELEKTLDRLFNQSTGHTRKVLQGVIPTGFAVCWIIILLIGVAALLPVSDVFR